jgi:site-specific DNA-cytosine methylase
LTPGAHPGSYNGQDVYNDMLFVDTPQAFRKSRRVSSVDDFETWVDDGQANTLNTFDTGDVRTTHAIVEPAVLMTMREGKDGGGKGPLLSVEQSLTLATGNGQTLFQPKGDEVESLTPWPEMGEAMRVYGDKGGSPTVKMHPHNILQNYGVRRLTPVECERLQSFPDGWTEPAGSDSARYKAMGNAVTVNVVQWILGRMIVNIDEQ